ncbi:MAG TPA: hypothetical protein DCZ75_12965 [Geobacter sp.]|nr:hypothetical protein [Geobacter sp.]
MPNNVVSKLYRTMSPQALLNELGSVAAAMPRNPAFSGNVAGNVATAAMLLEIRDKLATDIEAAFTHDTNRIKARNATQEQAVALLDGVSKFIELMSVSNPNVMHDNGFTPRPPSKKNQSLPVPLNFSVYHGPQPGTAIASASNLVAAQTWEIHVAEGDPSVEQNWRINSVHTDNSSMVMSGLNVAKQLYFRLRVLNRNGVGPWSPPVTLFPK